MTVKESTVCNLIQSFPVFLILAQNAQKCLKTPLVYKPPTPTHSPEYYEALDALFQSLYGHSHGGGSGSHGVYNSHGTYGGHGSHGTYGGHGSHGGTDHSYHYPGTSLSSCQYSYGKKWGSSSKPCYQYVYTIGNGYNTYGSGLQGYPSYALKKGNIYALNNVTTTSYAPSQKYSTKSRYQVVVKKTKIGKKRSRRSRGFFQPQRENQNGFFNGIFQGPNRVREGIQGFFNPNRQRRPVINMQPPQENVYIVVEDQTGGNVNFGQPNQGNQGFQQSNNGNGVNFDGNQYQPFGDQGGQNQGNGDFQNNGNGGMNIEENQPSGGDQVFNDNQDNNGENMGQEENIPVPPNDPVKFDDAPPQPDPTTTLAPLTPVPVVDTESRNNFNFVSTPVFRELCTTVDGGQGSCISLYDCAPYLKILKESQAQATQILRKAHCGFEGNAPKVCCPLPGFSTSPPQTTSTTTTTTTTTTTPAPAPTPTAGTKTVIGDYIPVLPEPPVCGQSNASFGRVVGGVNAKLDDFPWMAILGYKSRRGGTSWLCGGSLISSRHVLTAAHCIHNHENDLYVVRLGELDLAREDDGASPIDVLIKDKIKHEEYSASAFTNDIAILILERDVEFSNSIKPICIPKDRELRAKTFEDYNPLIAGWGHTEFRGPAATHLQVLQLPVVSNDYCAQAYSAYKAQKIDQRVLCAGFKAGGKDACQGDSGGPLMQPIRSTVTYKTYFYQIGVVSYGKKCAEAGFPGVYSRVTHFIPWIEEKVLGPR